MDTIPGSMIRAVGARVNLVAPGGSSQPLGVVAGMVFAMLTRASYPARPSWFQAFEWQRVSRTLCGLRPISRRISPPARPRSVSRKWRAHGAFVAQFGHLPAQPGDKSRVWGLNSIAQRPAFRGKVRKEIDQQCGFRAHEAPLSD